LYSLTALDGSIAISTLARKVFFQFCRFCGKQSKSKTALFILRPFKFQVQLFTPKKEKYKTPTN
jgi:hypothetical protein